MALKPTIYKVDLGVSDMDRNVFASHNLTVALHPSETLERMAVRLIAFALNSDEQLNFSRGLSNVDEPAIWQVSLDDRIEHWVDVGQPDVDRIKKALGRSEKVSLYSYGSSVDIWWAGVQTGMENLAVSVWALPMEPIQALAEAIGRTCEITVTITEGEIYLALGELNLQFNLSRLS